MRRFTFIILGFVLLLLSSDQVLAQCSMCKAVLSNTSQSFIRSYNLGVLVLLLPPVSIFCCIFIVLRRQNERRDNDQSTDKS